MTRTMDADHWEQFYAKAASEYHGPWYQPTQFAQTWRDKLPAMSRILELGCGNGRDAVYLAEKHWVTGIDGSQEAISLARAFAMYWGADLEMNCNFQQADFSDELRFIASFNVAYSRFSLHAVSTALQNSLLRQLSRGLQSPGLLLVEARSVLDGDRHQVTHHGHYRRLLHPDTFREELGLAGFRVLHFEVAQGERFGDDQPLVLQAVATTDKEYAL